VVIGKTTKQSRSCLAELLNLSLAGDAEYRHNQKWQTVFRRKSVGMFGS